MIDVLRDMSNAALVRAAEANLTAFHVSMSEWPEVTLHRDDDRVWTVSRRRFSLCNVLLEARFDSADVGRQIERALTPYRAANVNPMWKLGPPTLPGNRADRLREHGFARTPPLPARARDAT